MVPELVPPARLRLKALLLRPVMGAPVASSTKSVSVSVLPEATEPVAKLTVDFEALTGPATTWTVGFVVRVTPLTAAVSVLAVPNVVLAVNVAV
jgi:hypothetical protein